MLKGRSRAVLVKFVQFRVKLVGEFSSIGRELDRILSSSYP